MRDAALGFGDNPRMADPWEHLLPPPDGQKEARMHRIAWAVAHTLLRSGPDQVRIADVARRAGVSRPWIYKYVGGDRAALVAFATRLYGQAFVAPFDGEGAGELRAALAAGTAQGLRDTLAAPWCVLVFVRYRHARSPLGEQVRAMRQAETEALVARLPEALRGDPSKALAFAASFNSARLGLYHDWLDPAFRASVGEDAAVRRVLSLYDAFAAGG